VFEDATPAIWVAVQAIPSTLAEKLAAPAVELSFLHPMLNRRKINKNENGSIQKSVSFSFLQGYALKP